MQPQTLPDQQTDTIRVAFDINAGIEPLTFPASTPYEQITDRLRSAFLAADVIDEGHTFDVAYGVELGTVKVLVDGNVIEYGSITRTEPKPDVWLTLAADLAEAAERLASLAGTTPPRRITLHVLGAAPGNTDRTVATLVDTVAGVFDATPRSSSFPDGTSVYQADRNIGALRFQVSAYLPAEQSELERLRARNAELEAQLAEGGATREGRDPIDRRDLANDPWRCPVCHHEAEHLLDSGCNAAPTNDTLGIGTCGCKHVAGGAR